MVVAARPEFALEFPGGSVESEWTELCEASGSVPFTFPGWIRAWNEVCRCEVRLAAVRRGGLLVAALPVTRRRARLATPADWHTPVVEAAALDAAALELLARSLAEAAPAALAVDFVEAGSPTATAIPAALRAAGYSIRSQARMHSPYIDLSSGAAAYFDGLESRKKRELRRRRRRLDEAGTVGFAVSDGPIGLTSLLDEAFGVEASGWKGRRGTAIASDPAVTAMYRSAAAWAASRGMLVVGTLRLDGRLLAFDLALEHRGAHYLLKTGFDPEAGRFAPAMQLRALMIERAFDVGLASYEFAGTDDPWKIEWTDTVRRIVRIDAYAPAVRGAAAHVGDLAGRRLRRLGKRLRTVRPR